MGKRPKPPSQNGEIGNWKPGNVVRLQLKNFMCVNRVEYNFNSKLNWIIGRVSLAIGYFSIDSSHTPDKGPNGSGKSTIVCALYLVFNGKVNNLGRGTSIAQYINNRRPDAEAFIEVEIYETVNRNRIISRAWKSSGNQKWALDSRVTTASSIQVVLEKLNIQVENLLQFLPQEKVSTFNSLRENRHKNPKSDVARLQKFEEAIMAANGKSNLAVIHNNLIEYEENAHKSSETLNEARRELVRLGEEHNRLKDRVENYENFTADEKECYFLNLKRLLVINQYDEIKCETIQREYDHLKAEADAIKEELIGKTRQKLKILEADWKKREKTYADQVDLDSDENKGLLSKSDILLSYTRLGVRIDHEILGRLENEEEDYKRQVKKFHKGLTDIKIRKETLAVKEKENQRQRNEFEENKENWGAELKKIETQRKEAKENHQKAEELVRRKLDEKSLLKNKIKTYEERKKKQGDILQRKKQKLKYTLSREEAQTMMNAINYETGASGLIENNTEKFEHPIIQPALLTLNPSMDILSILLDHVSIRQMTHFYALNAHDNLALQRLTRDNGADVPVSFFGHPRELDLDYWKTSIPANIRSELARLGFERTILDYLQGPNEVLCAMAKWGNAHAVYVTKNELTRDQEQILDNIADQLSSFKYYTLGPRSECIAKKKMQFSEMNEISTQTRSIVPLSKQDDKVATFIERESEFGGQLDQLLQETKAALDAVEAERQVHQAENQKYQKIQGTLNKEWTELKSKMKGGATLSDGIRKAKEEIQKSLNNLPNITEAQARLKRHRVKAVKELAAAWAQFSKVYTELVNKFPPAAETTPTIARIFMSMNHLNKKMREEQERLADQELQVSLKLERLTTSKNQVQASHNEYKDFKRVLFHKYGEMKEKDLTRKLNQIKSRLDPPDNVREDGSINVEVWTAWLDRFKDELNARYEHQQSVVDAARENIDSDIHQQARQYEELKKQIQAKEKAMEKMEKEFDEKKRECQRLKATWLPELEDLVADVSVRLKSYFHQICCDGEVSINHPDDPSSYSKYELQIKVSFRDSAPLEALNVGRQSGGERSVSTMLFLLAMPTKNCPFRLVDEINQGMDQQNERNVIDVLSNVSNSPNCCQFFIITPKLLPNIDFPENSRVHVIHSIPTSFPFKLNDTARCLEDAHCVEDADEE